MITKHIIEEEVRNFKQDLIRCHYYNAKLIELNLDLIEIETRLFEPKVASYGEQTGQLDSYKTPKLNDMERHERIKEKIFWNAQHFIKMSHILEQLPDRISTALVYRYIYEYDMSDVAHMLGVDRSNLYKQIDRSLYKHFKNHSVTK